MRRVLATSSRVEVATLCFLFALAPIGGAGCHVGSAEDDDSGSPSPDASVGGDDDDGGDDLDAGGDDGDGGGGVPQQCVDLDPSSTVVGHHPAQYDFQQGGRGCITLGCHDGNTPGAPGFTVAGALYQGVTSGTPIKGGRIYITDQAGTVVELKTAENGFFYTTQALSGPFTLLASGCPSHTPMAAQADGNCNRGNCHDNDFRIFLGP